MEAAGWTGSLAAASRPGSESFLGFGLSQCVPKLFPPGSQKCSPSSQCVPPRQFTITYHFLSHIVWP